MQVASVDYLSNVEGLLRNPKVVELAQFEKTIPEMDAIGDRIAWLLGQLLDDAATELEVILPPGGTEAMVRSMLADRLLEKERVIYDLAEANKSQAATIATHSYHATATADSGPRWHNMVCEQLGVASITTWEVLEEMLKLVVDNSNKASAYKNMLDTWEMVCERDHGKEPGDFKETVAEIVKIVQDNQVQITSPPDRLPLICYENSVRGMTIAELRREVDELKAVIDGRADYVLSRTRPPNSSVCRNTNGCTNAGRYTSGLCGVCDIILNDGKGILRNA